MGILSTEQQAVKDYFFELMDDRIKNLRHCAIYDLHFGPMSAEYYANSADFKDWPGYVSAIGELESWADAHIVELWVDEDGGIATSEPEGETIDGCWAEPADHTHFDRKAVKRIVFDKLVTDGGMN